MVPDSHSFAFHVLASSDAYPRASIIEESSLFDGIIKPTWHKYALQMALKLLVARYVTTKYYVTLDADVAWQQFASNANVNRGSFDSVEFGAPIWNVGVAGTWILFEGYALKNNLREARALRRKARSELESIRIQAIGEVWDSYNDYLAAQRQFVFGEALLASSQEAYEAMLAAYEVGLATITELIASEKDLAASMAILVETRAKLLQSAARVGFALGSGFGAVPQVAKATNEP